MRKDPLIRLCLSTIKRHDMLRAGDRVLVAVSGGRDSMALLSILLSLQKTLSVEVVAGHVDHDLREDSKHDAEFVREYCRKNSIRFFEAQLCGEELKKGSDGLEMEARTGRLNALEHMAAEAGANRIATGHHEEDQALTVLYRILRGSATRGLGGIRPLSGKYIRPLLCATRDQIEAYIEKYQLSYRDDPTNKDRKHVRNALRLDVLPVCRKVMKGADRSLARLAEVADREAYVLQEIAMKDLVRCARTQPDGFILDIDQALSIGEARRSLMLRELIARMHGLKIEREQVDRIEKMIRAKSPSASARLGKSWIARRRYGLLLLSENEPEQGRPFYLPLLVPGRTMLPTGRFLEASIIENGEEIKASLNAQTALLAPEAIEGPLQVRTFIAGDRYRPAGLLKEKKLSDLYINAKIPACERKKNPIIFDANGIVWAVGFAPAYRCAHVLKEETGILLVFK